MGACGFDHLIEAYDAREAFDRLVADALYEDGHESYNGTISTCSMGRCQLRFEKYNETNRKKAYQYVEDKDWGDKWIADYIDLGVKEYHVLTVKKRPVSQSNPTYKLKFVVQHRTEHFGQYSAVQAFNTKTEADTFALEQTLKSTIPHRVVKEYVLEKGDATLTETYIEKKVYKSEPKLKPMPNRKVVPVHMYLFYGLAAC